MRVALPLLVALAAFSIDSAARACSGCSTRSLMSPAAGAEVPANALGLFWASHGFSADTATLTDLDTGMEILLDSEEIGFMHLFPAQPVEAGHQYRFTVPEDCGGMDTVQRTLIATAPVELPQISLGTLVASEPSLHTRRGSDPRALQQRRRSSRLAHAPHGSARGSGPRASRGIVALDRGGHRARLSDGRGRRRERLRGRGHLRGHGRVGE